MSSLAGTPKRRPARCASAGVMARSPERIRVRCDGVALRSSYTRLRAAIAASPNWNFVGIGSVRYIDYQRETFAIEHENLARAYLHKRKSFEHEHEVRVLSFLSPPSLNPGATAPDEWEQDNPVPGIYLRVELHNLIEAIYVGPDEPSWIQETVQRLVNSWGLSIPVRRSELNEGRLY